jgi:hypothetical protein
MDQNTGPQLFVATVAAVALKNHWNDKAFVRVILDQPIITLAMTRATRAKRGVFRPAYPKRAQIIIRVLQQRACPIGYLE